MRHRRGLRSLWFPVAALWSVATFAFAGSAAESGRTMGFAVTSWYTAIYESHFMDECPEGLSPGNDEIWWRGISKADRSRLTDDGLLAQFERVGPASRRGAKGEHVCQFPTSVVDPPLLTVEGKLSYGVNLDGTTDGKATAKSCAHQKFKGVDGTPAVDNQMYRLLGCNYGWRKDLGLIETNADGQRRANGRGMILIEVRNVDDPRNDGDVDVAFYRAIDRPPLASGASASPYGTYRIDSANGVPRYGSVVKGKIVDGVLTTQPADAKLPFYGNYTYIEQKFRDMSLRLEIDPSGERAKGTVAGYYDVQQLWDYIAGLELQGVAQYNCPALYVALHKLADGYPDASGQCTSISSAFHVDAVAAFIEHPRAQRAAGSSQVKGPVQVFNVESSSDAVSADK